MNQIKSVLLVYEAVRAIINGQVGSCVGQRVQTKGVWEEVGYMGTSGNRDCQWASRNVLKDFTEDALAISAGSLFQNGTARMVKKNWRRRVQHLC